jgi:hypothetical protein
MTRSKIFLGLTASVLGIAAFAASKTNFSAISVFYSLAGAGPHNCAADPTQRKVTSIQAHGSGRAVTTAPGTTKDVFITSKCVEAAWVNTSN